MKVPGLVFMLLVASVPIRHEMAAGQPQDYGGEIDSLLRQLIPVMTTRRQNTITRGPSPGTQQRVRYGLFKIASESAESRSRVIESLIGILEDSDSKRESIIAYRWTLAVDLLGDLRATEAIDILVRNLNETGQNGIVISLHYRPVASAIAAIGAPAIPRLIVALSDEDRGIRWEAASTLARIGSAAVNPLEEALSQDNADTKAGAALALTWIGGPEAEAAFKHAIETEMDPETLSKLKDALQEIHRRRGK